MQRRFRLFAFDGGRDLAGDEFEQGLVALVIAHVAGIALHHERANGAPAGDQRNAKPVQRSRSVGAEQPGLERGLQRLRVQQQRFSRAQDHVGQGVADFSARWWQMVDLVDEIGIGDFIRVLVVQRNIEISRRHECVDGRMDAMEQIRHVPGGMRGLGNPEQRGLHGLGLLALGDVADGAQDQFAFVHDDRRQQDLYRKIRPSRAATDPFETMAAIAQGRGDRLLGFFPGWPAVRLTRRRDLGVMQ